MFQLGLATFGIGSLLCGLAPSIGWLIAARVLQAVGGTMLNPVAAAIVATTFPDPAERARAIGVFSATTGLAQALGPIVGGALVDRFGWHSVFWINVPIGLAGILLAGNQTLFLSAMPRRRMARLIVDSPTGTPDACCHQAQ